MPEIQFFGHKHPILSILFTVSILALCSGCATEEIHQGQRRSSSLTPHQAYAISLEEARLTQTALGQAWFNASELALKEATVIQLPFREVGYLDPKEVSARGYQIDVIQGQVLTIDVEVLSTDSMHLFVDLYEVLTDSLHALRHVATADSSNQLVVEPRTDITYLVRIQPELLRGGRIQVDIKANAALGFPVAGTTSASIHSHFGAPRDGGRRLHKGVDIFADKGTPVVAISDGYVARIDETNIGGKVIWVRDALRNQAYYYAHLDKFMIDPFVRVQRGDTLGLIGNTGNAINTPAHLHFGIYAARRALDPFPFIDQNNLAPAQVAADTSRLGGWIRITSNLARLRKAPYGRADLVDELPRHTALRVVGGAKNWYYVQSPDGKTGFVLASLTEDAAAPIRNLQLASGRSLKYRPSLSAVAIDSIGADSELPVFGEFGDFLGVTSPNGRTGWIASMD